MNVEEIDWPSKIDQRTRYISLQRANIPMTREPIGSTFTNEIFVIRN